MKEDILKELDIMERAKMLPRQMKEALHAQKRWNKSKLTRKWLIDTCAEYNLWNDVQERIGLKWALGKAGVRVAPDSELLDLVHRGIQEGLDLNKISIN
jgi:hypothetical protein